MFVYFVTPNIGVGILLLIHGPVSAPAPESLASQPFRFLDLPPELRCIIYEFCMVRGTVYPAPRPKHDHRYNDFASFEAPQWALLRVNRQVRVEAAKILLSKNHFVLSYVDAETLFWT